MLGCETAVLARSTMHVFADVLVGLTKYALFVDDGAYPVAKWMGRAAIGFGVPVFSFAHFDADGLSKSMRTNLPAGRKPMVVTDGICVSCKAMAPLPPMVAPIRPVATA